MQSKYTSVSVKRPELIGNFRYLGSQHDRVRTTKKKGTPKILSKSISRMPMGSLVRH